MTATAVPVRLAVRTYTDGVAVVMPAYLEQENLAATVTDFLGTLDEAGLPHAVVVVDDGSSDRTGDVLDGLAAAYPDRVVAVHHEVNQGYGAAVRTGIAAALERTDLRWVLLTDSDGQFRGADLVDFLDVRRRERADAVIGYREHRADPWRRRLNARIWTGLCRLVLRVPSRDVDCAFKLIDRRLLDGVRLTGEAAAISPELLAKITVRNVRLVQHPVSHHPRLHGEQTGAKLSVIARSLASLASVYGQLVWASDKQPWVRRLLRPKDPVLALVTVAAILLSVGGYLYFRHQGAVLAYKDANSHLLIARRVLESPTAGAAQLGGVWLPLPHLLALPLVWNDKLYQTGLAGAVVSMVAFVVTVRYLYLLGASLARSRFAGIATALLFAVNANALYLQSTAMTESLLFACIVATIHYLHEWCRFGRYKDLIATSVAILLATLTRYEGWVLCLAALAVVTYTELRRHRSYIRFEASFIFFGFIAFAGIAGWLVWNTAIFHNPLYWKFGEYADSSLWVKQGEAAVGHLGVATRTYWLAAEHNIGLATLVLGGLGVIAYVARNRLRQEAVAVYPLLFFGVFFVYALYAGERPLHVKEVNGELYNVRFGLIMLIPASIFAGYLISLVPSVVERLGRPGLARLAKGAAAAGVLATALAVPGVVTLDEAREFRASQWESANAAASAWLRVHHDGGLTLMMSYENESVTFDSKIPTQRIVYEGSYQMWEPALRDPAAHHIEWIYMRGLPGQEDLVFDRLNGTPQLTRAYDLVYSAGDRMIYHRKEQPR
ncbi:glycosyltransferase [Paractinoplanes globisporus]|uniref:Glycosyltransferase n=1 Tax=Paractinoplanes globisporus TaxID=113565 RepID=A0ABW6WNA7_9ACTN|nr:glycosyltransferase [Actinoplanes globisporus]